VIFAAVTQATALAAVAGNLTHATAPPVAAGTTAATSPTNAAAPGSSIPLLAATTASSGPAGATAVTSTSGADAPAASAPSRPFAAPQTVNTPNAPTAGGLAQVTFALLLVLVAIFAAAWIARRMRGFNNRVGDAIDILADVPLGQKERAVLLKVGEQQILVGVAPGRVNTLHVLEQPLELKKPSASPTDSRPNFKQLMLRSLGK
jgi:flagellar protein FliO/FliZ